MVDECMTDQARQMLREPPDDDTEMGARGLSVIMKHEEQHHVDGTNEGRRVLDATRQ